MSPIQEINVFMSNGDVAKALLHKLPNGSFRADFDYQNSVGPKLDPHAGPVSTAHVCFDHMIGTIMGIAPLFKSSIARVSNPCNDELLKVAEQQAILSARGIAAPVDLNK